MGNSSWGRRNEALLRTLNALFLGQLVSFIMALTTFTSSLAANLGVNTPLSLSFITYLSLTLVYGSILLYRRQKLLVSWYWYALLGFVDVQGNYLHLATTYCSRERKDKPLLETLISRSWNDLLLQFIADNKAFHYSSITSVALLDCFTIAWVIILTWIFLGTRYTLRQFVGAAVCILGLGFVLLSDSGVGGGGGSKPLLGDILIIAATFFYAISNSGEEFCIKRKDRVEALGMMGLFGLLVTVCEIGTLERKNLELVKWSTETVLIFVGYGVGDFLFYTSVSFFLKMSGATMFNLSLLTSDMWVVAIRIFFYRQQVDWLYYFSFALVVIGLVIYSKFEKDHAPLPALEDGNFNPEYQRLNGESPDSRDEPVGS